MPTSILCRRPASSSESTAAAGQIRPSVFHLLNVGQTFALRSVTSVPTCSPGPRTGQILPARAGGADRTQSAVSHCFYFLISGEKPASTPAFASSSSHLHHCHTDRKQPSQHSADPNPEPDPAFRTSLGLHHLLLSFSFRFLVLHVLSVGSGLRVGMFAGLVEPGGGLTLPSGWSVSTWRRKAGL